MHYKLDINSSILLGWVAIICKLVGIVVIMMIGRKLVAGVISRSFQKANGSRTFDQRKARTLEPLARNVTAYVMTFIGLLLILETLNVKTNGIIAAASLLSLAVGFGAQNLVRDVITGFFILFEDQYAVGDYVTIAGSSGVVEEIGLRVTRVRDNGGQLYIIPNGQIAQVTNHTGDKIRVSAVVTLRNHIRVDEGIGILSGMCKTLAGETYWAEVPRVTGITRLGDSSYDLEVTGKTDYGNQGKAEKELRLTIKRLLENAKYESGE